MIKRLRRRRTSTFVRYALSYVTLLTIVLTVVFGYMYIYVGGEVRGKATANHVNRLNRVAFQHEAYLSSMLNTAMQIGLSPYIEPFSYWEDPTKAYDLLRQMTPYTITNYFCDQIYLCFSGDDHIYSSSSSMTLDMFMSLMHFEKTSAEDLLYLLRNPGKMTMLPSQMVESTLIDGASCRMITLLTPLGANVQSSKGTMMFLIKESVYWEIFADAIEDSNNTYIFHNGQVLASECDFAVPTDVVAQQLDEVDALHFVELQHKGEEWLLLSLHGEEYGMQYVTVLRAADLDGSVWMSMRRLISVLLIMSVAGVLVSLILAKRNTLPIREISSMLPGSDVDELSAIQTGIRELSARNTDLTSRLERSIPMQRHDFVLRFMKGRYATREEAALAASALGMNIDKQYFAVVLSGVQDHNDHPLDLRREPFDSLTGAIGCGVELVALNVHMYLLFADEPATLRTMAETIREVTMERSGHAIVALSGVQSDFASAPSAYLEAATAYDNRFVMDENRILDYSTISTSIEGILPKARKITDGINQALILGNRDLLSGKIGELLQLLKHTNMSPFVFRLIYNDTIATLLRERTAALASDREMNELYDIFSLSNCQSLDDLDSLLRKLCDSILQAEEKRRVPAVETEQPSVIGQVVSYIQDHFADPELSISAIAEAFEMPTARLSLAFKEIMHMSPLEYLTLLRVERSKTLLAESDTSIKDIAAEVGYYDASSFIRRFKQMTGITPLQYRRSKEDDAHAES